jgi:hypothetical protein
MFAKWSFDSDFLGWHALRAQVIDTSTEVRIMRMAKAHVLERQS